MDYIDDTVGWGASLEAEFQDNTNWDFDVSDEDDLDQFGGDVFSELAELEHMVQQCTLAEPDESGGGVRDDVDFSDRLDGLEIIRADDKVEEGLDDMPSISNLKSRFEADNSSEPSSPASPSHSPKRASWKTSVEKTEMRVNGTQDREHITNGYTTPDQKEEVEFTQMRQVKSSFERSPDQTIPSSPKRTSKWDKPKAAPPPPVNRREDSDEEAEPEEELPAEETTRNLVAKFKELAQGPDDFQHTELKPVRKMTPPREEVEQSVASFNNSYQEEVEPARDPNIVKASDETVILEEELPEPAHTKSILAKFRSMENINGEMAPPSPKRVTTTTTVTTTQKQRTESVPRAASPPPPVVNGGRSESEGYNEEGEVEGGVYENEPVVPDGVVREADRVEENEMPEEGFTKTLLAQWRQIEQQVGGNPTVDLSKRKPAGRSWSYREKQTSYDTHQSPASHHSADNSPEQVEQPVDQGVYENSPLESMESQHEDQPDELPPPSFTKNMLAKFQSLQSEDQQAAAPRPSTKRHFKWQVKEARTLSRPLSVAGEEPVYQTEVITDNSHDSRDDSRLSEQNNYQQYEEEEQEEEVSYQQEETSQQWSEQPEEMPQPSFTKNMLAKFRSLEDVNKAPPMPQYASKQRSDSSRKSSNQSQSALVTFDQQQQPDMNGEVFEGFQGEAEAGEFENNPTRDPSISREADQLEEELPERGTTASLRAKFQSLQAV